MGVRRKLTAALAVLALTACFGRAGAWAAAFEPGEGAHACCPAPDAPRAPEISGCCPDAAAVAAPGLERLNCLIAVSTPEADEPSALLSAAPEIPAPPGPQARLSSAPARAPPLG
jgi:hypothetical protein